MDKINETYPHNFIILNWHFSQIIDNKKRLGAAMEIIVPDADKVDLFYWHHMGRLQRKTKNVSFILISEGKIDMIWPRSKIPQLRKQEISLS